MQARVLIIHDRDHYSRKDSGLIALCSGVQLYISEHPLP
jgi:hypothetical protein